MIRIIHPGPLGLVEDLGRPGHARFGVGRGGAMDRGALRQANRLVGNHEDAAALEFLLGGALLEAEDATLVTVTGAPVPLWINGRPVAHHRVLALPVGAQLRMGTPDHGLRSYVAVRGGVLVDDTLGSASSAPTSGLGPAPLLAGDRIEVGQAIASGVRDLALAEVTAPVADPTLRVVLGPRDDWFTADAVRLLTTEPWQVSTQCDRVGIRLSGSVLDRARHEELASEALVPGAIQVPKDGQPLVFAADHPVTGGYPVIAVVVDDDLDALGQLRPGATVRFERVPRGW